MDEYILERRRAELHVLESKAVLVKNGGRRRDEQRGVAREVKAHPQRPGLGGLRNAVLHGGLDRLDPVDPRQPGERIDDGAVGRPVGGELERALALERAHQSLRRVESEQLPVVHDPDPVGEQPRLVHVVGREDERDVGVAQLAQPVPDEEARRRIETRGRLVEEEHPWRVHKSARDHHALRLSAGEEVGLVLRAVEKAELVEQLVGTLLALARRNAVVRRVEDEVVADRDGAVEVALLRHDGELHARPHRVAHNVDAAEPGYACSRPHAGRQHPDRRRLPRSIRPEQPEDLTRGNAEGHAVDGVHR